MGIFKNIKKRYIVLIGACIAITIGCGVYIAITLWPKDEKPITHNPDNSGINKLNDLLNPKSEESSSNNGHYYTMASCEELAQLTGQSCDNNTDSTPSQYTYTYSYTAPESTPTQTPTQYNVPSIDSTPDYTPTCADHHVQYYADFTTKLHEINTRYTNAINSAASSCSSFGGCPQKTKLEQQWQNEAAMLKNSYKTNMANAGCDPNQYVDF